ncbi:hypothetical protein HMPREF9103_02926 [Lentilactobacillus parafarraginis F0439]|uniref:Uncharacterized protein n=1 Tax=Lentilactobacillus parafarraginis F0439 TaxID=797515 RepID=G9ZT09_9LACO|nr:hypothetical protein HMPREF9103_02926 [Lentilactobacillus parafarraginis F0439]
MVTSGICAKTAVPVSKLFESGTAVFGVAYLNGSFLTLRR